MFRKFHSLNLSGRVFQGSLAYLLVLQLLLPWNLRANPVGGDVVAGQANIQGGAGTLTVNQLSQRAIINWQDFSIAQGELTKFVQPNAASAVLNRVVGSNLSGIYGTLQANGQVYLINPNGIVIGPTGVVNTAGFVASTLDVDNSQFLAGGDLTFKGNSTAKVINMGKIGASEHDVILIAQEVENAGEISAVKGKAGLAAGNEVLVKASGQERIFVQAGKGRVSHSGLIESATAELKAAGGNEYALAINNTGTVRALGAVNEGGRILLKANSGKVKNSGTLIAKANPAAGALAKADVRVFGDEVELVSGARIEAAGGFVETSGTTVNIADGVTVTTLAENGTSGLWLIDPNNFVIAASGGNMTGAAVSAALAGGNFTIQTVSMGTPGGNGDIFVNDAVTWSNANKLTLDAEGAITINDIITGYNGVLTLLGPNGVTVTTNVGSIKVSALRVEALNGSVLIPLGGLEATLNSVGTLAGRALGNFYFASSSNYQIQTVDGLDGMVVGGALTLANQALGATIGQNLGAGGIIQASTLNTFSGGSVNLSNPLNLIGTLGSVDTTFGGAVTFVDFSFALAHDGNLSVGTIVAGAGISIGTVGNLTTTAALSSKGNISLRSATKSVVLGAAVTSLENGVTLRSFNDLNTGAFLVSATSAVTGDVTLISDNGTVGIGSGGVTVGDTLAIQVAGGQTLNIAGAVTAPNVTLVADNINVSAAIHSTGTISLAPVTAGTNWTLGGAAAGTNTIDSTELGFLSSAATLNIGRNFSNTTTIGTLTVAGGSIASNTLNLYSSAGINQSLGLILAGGGGTLNVTAGGNVSLIGGNEFAVLSGSTTSGYFNVLRSSSNIQAVTVNTITTNGGDIVLRNFDGNMLVSGPITSNGGNIIVGGNANSGQTLSLQNNINAGTGSIALFSHGGISQSAGVLTGTNLMAYTVFEGVGSIALNQNNVISGNVGLSTVLGSDISFYSTSGFVVGGISSLTAAGVTLPIQGGPGIRTSDGGTVTLMSGGNVTQATGTTDIISTGTLNVGRIGATNPNVTLDNANNAITNLGTVTTGNGAFTLKDLDGLTITGSAVARGGYSVTTDGGSLTQNAGATIDTSGGGGTISLVTLNGGSTGFAIQLNDSLGAGTGNVSLSASGGVSQIAGGIFSNNVSATAAGLASGVSLASATNSFNGISGSASGSGGFNVANSKTLTVGASGISATAGNIGLTTTGASSDLQVNGVIHAGTQNIALTAGRNITQSAAGGVQAANLQVNAGNGSVDLILGAAQNQISKIAGQSNGNFSYTDQLSTALTIGTVTTTGITSSTGDVSVLAENGSLQVSGLVSATSSGGDVTLAGKNGVSVASGITVQANATNGVMSLAASNGNIVGSDSVSALKAAKLRAAASGNVDLTSVLNVVGASGLALSSTNGFVVLYNSGAIQLDTVAGGYGISAAGPVVLAALTGDITQTSAGTITAGGGLLLQATNGAIVLDQANNVTGNFAVLGTSSGDITLRNTGGLNVGTVGPVSTQAFLAAFGGVSGGTSHTISLTSDTGNITQSATSADKITGGTLRVKTGGGDVTLLNSSNALAGLGTSDLGAGKLALFDSAGGLRVSGSTTANGGIQIQSNGDLTLDSGASLSSSGTGNSVVLVGANFINNSGATAVDPGAGRFLIYSTSPDANTFGGLLSGEQALYDRTYAGDPPSGITETGNRYLFSSQPTITVTTTSAVKTYGDDLSGTVGGMYAFSGFTDAGLYGDVFTQDTAANSFSGMGTPAAVSAGADILAPVLGSPYAVTIDITALSSLNGYALTKSETGVITVNKRAITVTAGSGSSFSGSNPANPGIFLSGGTLVGGQTLQSLGLGNNFNINSGTPAGSYVILVTGNSDNYDITRVSGNWAVESVETPQTVGLVQYRIPAAFQASEANDENNVVDGVTDFVGSGKGTFSFKGGEGSKVVGAMLHLSSEEVE